MAKANEAAWCGIRAVSSVATTVAREPDSSQRSISIDHFAWVLDALALEVQKIRPLDAEAVAANKLLFEAGDDVVEVYGARLGEPVRVLFIDETRILRPEEDPALVLYPTGDEFVLQTRWMHYTTRLVAFGAGAAAALLLAPALWLFALAQWLRRRRAMRRAVEPAAAV